MKNLNNSLFKKFEPNKINNLAKIVGGEKKRTTWTGINGTSGCDDFYAYAEHRCLDTEMKDYIINGTTQNGDMVYVPCSR